MAKEFIETGVVSKKVDFEKAIAEKQVLTGRVITYREGNKAKDIEPRLILDVDGKKVAIDKDDIGVLPHKKGPAQQVGYLMKVVIKGQYEDGLYYGSRIEAVRIESQPAIDLMKKGEYITGVVGDVKDYGAYVRFGAGMMGLMRNMDCSDDTKTAKDMFRPNDFVDITFVKESSNGEIYLKPLVKKESEAVVVFDDVQEGDVYYGVIRQVKEDCVFISIGKNLIVLAKPPLENQQVSVGQKVQVTITKVRSEDGKIKGLIKRILGV